MKKENRFQVPKRFSKFTPSSASKCKRELYYKIKKMEQEDENQPYNNRWTRNSTAVHEAVQRDMLYAEKFIDSPDFSIQMIETEQFGSLPAWEKQIENYKIHRHDDQEFVVSGMMDGLLTHNPTGKTYGFEFKTKTNSSDQVHKMTKPAQHHIQQATTYSLIFEDETGRPLRDFFLVYEAVPKDKWGAGVIAWEDLKVFHVHITDRQRNNMLKKFAEVAKMVDDGELPDRQRSKCMFCPFKKICLPHAPHVKGGVY